MKKLLIIVAALFFLSSTAYGDDGMIRLQSTHDVKTTADRLEKTLNNKGMTVFTRINHAAGAEKSGMELRPTELVIFGNPKVGTPLMKCSQSTAIDLPQKALIMEDASNNVWLIYNDPQFIAKRHNIDGCEKIITKIENALKNFATAATSP